MSFKSGPYVIAATICQDCKQEPDGSLALMRLGNGLTLSLPAPEAPDKMPPLTAKLQLVLLLAPGSLRGRHVVKFAPQVPTGEIMPAMVFAAQFGEDHWTPPLKIPFEFTFGKPGLYWFVIRFDDVPLTKVPFNVRYIREPAKGAPIQNS